MIENSKYASFGEILSRVTTLCRGFDKTVNEIDIIEWCMLVETHYCPNVDNMYIYTNMPLKVTNGRAKVPCNRYRIADVTEHPGHHGHRLSFNDLGSFISFHPDSRFHHVYMDYWGTPIDLETGKPLIQIDHIEACAWFCMYNLFLYDHGTGKITSDFWHGTVEANFNKEIDAARSSNVRFKTRGELNDEMRITFDELPVPARLWLLRDEWHGGLGEVEYGEHRHRGFGEPAQSPIITAITSSIINTSGLRRQEFTATAGQTQFLWTKTAVLPDVFLVFIDDAPQRTSLFTKVGNLITSQIPLTTGQILTVYA